MKATGFSEAMKQELDHRDREYGDDKPTDPHVLLYDLLSQIEDGDDKELVKEARQWMVEQGVYREASDEELSRTSSTGKKYDFTLDGRKYVFVAHPEGWKKWQGEL